MAAIMPTALFERQADSRMPRVSLRPFISLCRCVRRAKEGRLSRMNTTTVASNNPMNRSSCPLVLLVIPIALACFVLSATAWATCQQGCLLHANTALGEDALSRNQRQSNTAIGASALFANYTGSFNTAVGAAAMEDNTTAKCRWNHRGGVWGCFPEAESIFATRFVSLMFASPNMRLRALLGKQ